MDTPNCAYVHKSVEGITDCFYSKIACIVNMVSQRRQYYLILELSH